MFLAVTGIRPGNGSIRPDGNHLRWLFPAGLGFPGGGFEIFRREAELKPATLQHPDPVKLAASPAVPQYGLTVALDGRGGFRPAVTDDNSPAIEVRPQGARAVIFVLTEPLAYFVCDLHGATGQVEIRAYGGDHRLVERREEQQDQGRVGVKFHFPGITRLELRLPFEKISGIGIQTVRSALDATDWEKAEDLPILLPSQESAALHRLANVQNYHAGNEAAARQKYGRELADLLRWLELVTDVPRPLKVVEPSPVNAANVTAAAQLPVLSTLLLAALDPNIARFLSLYWVDAKTGAYDYKVRGHWKQPQPFSIDGLALGVGMQAALPPPAVPQSMAEDMNRLCRQLPGFTWENLKPLGRMALRWAEPVAPTEAALHAVLPVFYEVIRESDGTHLTKKRLALVTRKARADTSQPWLIDPAVPMGPVRYAVSGIDLFGRKGDAAKLSGIAKEVQAPPPPVRLRCEINKDQTELSGSFEFGAMQSRRHPMSRASISCGERIRRSAVTRRS